MSDEITQLMEGARQRQEAIDNLSEKIGEVKIKQDTQSRNTKLLAVSILLDVLLSFGLGGMALNARTISRKANASSARSEQAVKRANLNHTQNVTSCKSSNEARAINKNTWDYIFKQIKTPTPESKIQLRIIKKHIDDGLAPKDCSHIK